MRANRSLSDNPTKFRERSILRAGYPATTEREGGDVMNKFLISLLAGAGALVAGKRPGGAAEPGGAHGRRRHRKRAHGLRPVRPLLA